MREDVGTSSIAWLGTYTHPRRKKKLRVGLCQGEQEKKKHITEVPKNQADLVENCYSGVFRVADCRSSFRFKQFKMADQI